MNGADANFRFAIKSDFVENGVHEHMWSQVSVYKGENFDGVFIDSPFDLKNIKTGDKVSIKKINIEDWIIDDYKTKSETGYFSKNYLNKNAKK